MWVFSQTLAPFHSRSEDQLVRSAVQEMGKGPGDGEGTGAIRYQAATATYDGVDLRKNSVSFRLACATSLCAIRSGLGSGGMSKIF